MADVQTVNPFDLLEDDTADVEIPEEAPAPVKPKAPVRLPKQAEKPAAKAPAAPAEEKAPVANGRGGPVARGRGSPSRGDFGGGRGRGRGGYDRDGPPRPPRDANNAEGGEGGYGGERRPPRGSGDRGRGRGRGPRGDGDRHPRNGFQETIKREGQGKGNWGSDQEAIKDAEKAEAGEEVRPVEAVEEEPPAETPVEEVTPPPEEEKEMTLDEYEKILEERRASLNKVTPKKPYKVDEKEFKGLKIHTKKDVEEDVIMELTNKKTIGARKAGLVEKPQKERVTVEANFRFADESRPERGRGRGPRGGGRGRGRFDDDRPRGPPPGASREFRGPPRDSPYGGPISQPRINDESTFPALATKVTAAT